MYNTKRPSDKALCILNKKPKYWETLLYFQVFLDEVAKCASLRQTVESGFRSRVSEDLGLYEAYPWIDNRTSDMLSIMKNARRVTLEVSPYFNKASSDQEDVNTILLAAKALGEEYKKFLVLAQRIIDAGHDPIFDGLFNEWSKSIYRLAQQLVEFASSWIDTVENLLNGGEIPSHIKAANKLVMRHEFEIEGLDSISHEVDRIKSSSIPGLINLSGSPPAPQLYSTENHPKQNETLLEKQPDISRRIPRNVQREVWRRDQGRCVECGSKEKLEFDHIIPFARGGSNTVRNVQLLCETCNRSKGAGF